MEKTDKKVTTEPFQFWLQANQTYLKTNLSWLQLILHRRVLWLRQQWQHDPLQNYQELVISDAQVDWLLTGEDRTAEQKFYKEDRNASKITQAIKEAKQELEVQTNTLLKAGTPTALDVLSQIFGLNSFDRMVLLFCLAPELDPAFERLYAYVQDEVSRKYVTPNLVLSLFAEDTDSDLVLRHSFLPGAPLFEFKLLDRENSAQIAQSWNTSPLRINPRIADYLQGINRLDERVAEILKPLPRVELLAQKHEEVVNQLQHLIEASDKKSPFPVLNFTGTCMAGKRDVASRLCETLRIELYKLNPKRLHSSGMQGYDIAAILKRECTLIPIAIYIDVSEMEDSDDSLKSLLEILIEELKTFLIVGSREPWRGERELFVVLIPKLNGNEQALLWKQQLEKYAISLNGQIDAVVEQFDFESDMIAKTITTASIRASIREEKVSSLTINDIWLACREHSQKGLDNLARRIIPYFTWEDIVLPKETYEQLKDIVAQVDHRAFVYEKWGFGAKLSRGRGISALFSGHSGTGKTMAAEIFANRLKLDLYRIDLSAVVSKYIGETEKNMRRVFDAAEQSGAILFFDEADALFGKRTEVKDSHDRYANIEINYLLQRMEDYRGLVILATNMKSLLDQAFLRRLRFSVEFPFPDTAHRQMIWQKAFPPQAVVGNLDHSFLVRLEISGGNIKNIALNAAFLAASDGQIIEMNHVLRATKREYAKIDKLVLESEFGNYYSQVKQA